MSAPSKPPRSFSRLENDAVVAPHDPEEAIPLKQLNSDTPNGVTPSPTASLLNPESTIIPKGSPPPSQQLQQEFDEHRLQEVEQEIVQIALTDPLPGSPGSQVSERNAILSLAEFLAEDPPHRQPREGGVQDSQNVAVNQNQSDDIRGVSALVALHEGAVTIMRGLVVAQTGTAPPPPPIIDINRNNDANDNGPGCFGFGRCRIM